MVYLFRVSLTSEILLRVTNTGHARACPFAQAVGFRSRYFTINHILDRASTVISFVSTLSAQSPNFSTASLILNKLNDPVSQARCQIR